MSALLHESMNTAPRLSMPLTMPVLFLSCQLLMPTSLKAFSVENVGCAVHEPAPLRTLAIPTKREASPQKATIDLSGIIGQLEVASQLSRSALASMIGVSRPTFYSWAQGKPVRRLNALRTIALATAMGKMAAFHNGAPLPILWQYQRLPSFGVSFVEGSQQGLDAGEMANELIALWTRDRAEAETLDELFAARG